MYELAYARPVPGPITQNYSEVHRAVDYASSVGDPVFAATAGQLTYHWDADLGKTATIKGPQYITTYSHLSVVAPPGWYDKGAVIGQCGVTGRLTTGPHVHFTLQLAK